MLMLLFLVLLQNHSPQTTRIQTAVYIDLQVNREYHVSVYVLVLLGAVLVSGAPRQYVSRTLTDMQDLIANELGLKQPEVGNTELFSFVNSINTSCEKKNDMELMITTLGVYKHIFSSIMKHSGSHQHHGNPVASVGLLDQVSDSKRSDIESALQTLQQKMGMLNDRLSRLNRHKEDILGKLKQIKVDDLMDQKRALAEYLGVFQAASVIAHGGC
ncbi:uncharacterized protein LOC115773787 [Archocentrus centrarchus]|uniref:uncharacterized protein LOC115773787 n=1 Tax=Archocentrus centrarchus TaxID=63155 RepID=UPI0011EA2481|nr:uncharacterized protein LOC115773787 [Archocentrus centrarchus]